MSIAAFIDVQGGQRDLATELAVAAAEYCVARNEPLYLLTDSVTALEVGVSLLGARGSRIVEGAKYDASPIVLLPFIRRDTPDDQILRAQPEGEDGAEIAELQQLGLFARSGESDHGFDFGSEPAGALRRVIGQRQPERLLGFGDTPIYWQAVSDGIKETSGRYRPTLITVLDSGSHLLSGMVETVILHAPETLALRRSKREEVPEDKALEEARWTAQREGALVAALFAHLTGDDRRRIRR